VLHFLTVSAQYNVTWPEPLTWDSPGTHLKEDRGGHRRTDKNGAGMWLENHYIRQTWRLSTFCSRVRLRARIWL